MNYVVKHCMYADCSIREFYKIGPIEKYIYFSVDQWSICNLAVTVTLYFISAGYYSCQKACITEICVSPNMVLSWINT